MKQGKDSAFLSNNRLWTILLVLISFLYFANSFSPFRLTNDTVRYFALAEDLLGTWPFGAPHDFLPYGYVYFIAGLERLHILTPLAICSFQILYLTGSLFFVKRLFGSTTSVAPFACLVLLSTTILKFTITPLSEMQFLFFSTGTFYCYQRFITGRKFVHLVAAFIFCFVSILTRTAGVTLAAALLLSFLISTKKEWFQWLKQYRAATVCIALTIVVLLTFIVTRPKFITYLSYFFRPLSRYPGFFIARNIRMHLTDWAELFFNVPYSKTVPLLPQPAGIALYLCGGILFLWLVFRKMILQKQSIPLPVRVYMIFYMLLIFNWPFFEARFWLPLIPFIVAILLQRREATHPLFYKAGMMYACYYLLSGIFGLYYYINLSFNHRALVNKHDAGKWKREYEYHFGTGNDTDTATMDKKAIYLLQKYDR